MLDDCGFLILQNLIRYKPMNVCFKKNTFKNNYHILVVF